MRKKRLITENNNNIIPLPSMQEIEGGKGMVVLYRVAFSDQIDSIFTHGYSRDFTGSKGGNMYGPGVYCTVRLDDTINNLSKEYGNTIVQMRLISGFKNFLIFDQHFAQKMYGDNWRIPDQLKHFGFDERFIRAFVNTCKKTSKPISFHSGRTAPAAYILWKTVSDDIFLKHGVRGLIYKGNRDGFCALPYDFSSIIPYAVSYDRGKTFKKRFDEKLYNYMKDHTDSQFKFGGAYKSVGKSVKGFTLIQNNENKYNFINHATNKHLSPIWFDEIDGTISSTTGKFGFQVGPYHFFATINFPKDMTDDFAVILDPGDNYYCGISLLGNLVDAMKQAGVDDLDDFIEFEEAQENNNQMNETINYLVKSYLSKY